jgi:glycosyltransferase involved in cell wall biosynthesis
VKVILVGNAPWSHSAYAGQLYSIAKSLQKDGHKVWWMPNFGFEGGFMEWDGIEFLPSERGGGDGNNIIGWHVLATEADIVLSLSDVHTFQDYGGSSFRWVAYTPIDSTKVDGLTRQVLKRAWRVVTPSLYGQARLEEVGISARHIPHGLNSVFTEPPPADAGPYFRDKHNIPEDAFLIGSVGRHAYHPGRKQLDRLLKAYSIFRSRHPDDPMVLYLHTDPAGEHGALSLVDLAQHLGIKAEDLRFPDPYNYHLGYTKEALVCMYTALDLYVQPSGGEGFGLPVIEAQACGTTVIASDNTCMRELIFDGAGTFVPMESWQYASDGGEHGLISIDGLVDALEDAYGPSPKYVGDRVCQIPDLIQIAQMQVRPFSWDLVWGAYWRPFLADCEAEIKAQQNITTLPLQKELRSNILEDRGDLVRKRDTGQEHRDEQGKNQVVISWGKQRGIVEILEEGEDEFGRYWFDTKKMVPLSDISTFTPEQRSSILADVRAGLEYMNAQGYAHRDVSIKNVLIDDDGSACLFDFDWMEKMSSPEIATQVDFEPWESDPALLVPSFRAGLTSRGFHRIVEHVYGLKLHESTATSLEGVPYQAVEGIGERNCGLRWIIIQPDVKGKRVVDLGCNLGWFTNKALEEGAESVVAVDEDMGIIQAATKLHSNCNGAFRQMNLDKELPEGEFDVAFFFSVWGHLVEGKKTVMEFLKKIPTVYFEGKSPSKSELEEMGFTVERLGHSERGRNLFKLTSAVRETVDA